MVRNQGSGVKTACVQVLALPFISFVIVMVNFVYQLD